jgi:hypothetical protein
MHKAAVGSGRGGFGHQGPNHPNLEKFASPDQVSPAAGHPIYMQKHITLDGILDFDM